MTSPDPITQIAGLRLEPTYSAREAALLLGRSYSWLDQRLHAGQFVRPDGTFVQPLRTARRLPAKCTARVFRVISDASIAELQQFLALVTDQKVS